MTRDNMFSVGDYVVYAEDGVCQVVGVGKLSISSRYARSDVYYTLRPLFYKGTIYSPVDARTPMRALISRDEALSLLDRLPMLAGSASYASDKKQLTEYYKSALSPNTCDAFAKTYKGIYEKYHAPEKLGKLPGTVEMQYFKRASEMLVQELSVALKEPMASVQDQIERVCGMGKGLE